MIFDSKKIVLIKLASLSLCAVLLLTVAACSAKTAAAGGSDAYDYPVKPGTDAWKALGSHADMLNACQIPETTLNRMSTAGLVETVLNYPLFGDAWAWDNPQEGFVPQVPDLTAFRRFLTVRMREPNSSRSTRRLTRRR